MLNFSAQNTDRELTISKFGGVDFSTQPSKVELSRSPDMANMIMNEYGYMEKRTGYKRLYEGTGRINGIYEYKSVGGTFMFLHEGTDLHIIEDYAITKTLFTDLADNKSTGFEMNGAFFIMDGKRYIKLLWDDTIPAFVCGHVDAITPATDTTVNVITGRTPTTDTATPTYNGDADGYYNFDTHTRFKITYALNNKQYLWVKKLPIGKQIFIHSVTVNGSPGSYEFNVYADSYVKLLSGYTSGWCTVEFSTDDEYIYRPTLVINRKMAPESTWQSVASWGGDTLEAVNLGNSKRCIEFIWDSTFSGSSSEYVCALEPIINGYNANGKVTAVYKNGVKITPHLTYSASRVVLHGTFTATDRIKVFYEVYEAYANTKPINKCTIFGLYGGDNDTRVFFAGNPDAINTDYSSGIYDATYFPDNRYTKIGEESSAIIGYHKLYSNQVILKDGKESSTQYLRQFNGTVYPVKQGAASEGAICKDSFKTIRSMPFYIGKNGVFALASTNVADQNNAVLKSDLINGKFLKLNLANCLTAADKDKYYIYNSGNMYVYDTTQGEWFYWTGFPNITCFNMGDDFLFGTDEGLICKFLKPTDATPYYDDVAVDGSITEAKEIDAYWTIPQTTLNDWTHYKTIKNFYVTCMPYVRSSLKVSYNTNETVNEEVLSENIDLFDWNNIDFSRFTFNSIEAPFPFATGIKIKNVYVFGARLQNDIPGEPFGFLAFSIKYLQGKIVK